ncbi:MAG: SpoIIE family protein phosphatase [Planctomycetes bacterium]|nr:SpoIIE family protein phosphatase [Planctomycetota bacterium]
MAQLRYINDAGELSSKNLDSEQFLIGRATSCQITFDDDMVSREHVRIDMQPDGRFQVRDLGSRNKTYVNGELITETLLCDGDVVRIGDRVVEYLDDSLSRTSIGLDFIVPDRAEPGDCDWVKVRQPMSLTLSQVQDLALLWSDQALMARPEDIAGAALGQIILDLQGERGLIALRGEDKTDLRPVAHRALRTPTSGSMVNVSQSFILAPVLQSVAGRYPQTASKISAKRDHAATAVVAPLTFKGDIVGVLYVDRPASKKPFSAAALQYAMAAGAQVGTMLGEASRRLARSAAREGVAWMTTLRRIQVSLTYPVVSSDSFDVAAKCFPGRARCGDFGDVIHIDEQRCAGLVVDGGGHGVYGLLQATAIRAGVRASLAISDEVLMDPALLFNELNEAVSSSPTRQVIPCTFVGIDMSAGKMVYINAGGMPPLLMVAPGRLVTLDQPSLVLGVDPDYIYEATRVDVPEAFRVICHTDGLTEATSTAGEPLGDRRMHETFLQRSAFAKASEVLARIGNAWTTHLAGAQPDDDALVLVLGRG